MSDKAFLGTNVVIYAFVSNDPRAEVAEKLLSSGGVVGVQVLNEFSAVARRKLCMTWDEVQGVLDDIRTLCARVIPITVELHEAALAVARCYGYRIYDALIVATAINAGCTTLYSEDMHDGQKIDGLTIRNPFRDGGTVAG
jgi:predicted nucleic acid-binding protein